MENLQALLARLSEASLDAPADDRALVAAAAALAIRALSGDPSARESLKTALSLAPPQPPAPILHVLPNVLPPIAGAVASLGSPPRSGVGSPAASTPRERSLSMHVDCGESLSGSCAEGSATGSSSSCESPSPRRGSGTRTASSKEATPSLGRRAYASRRSSSDLSTDVSEKAGLVLPLLPAPPRFLAPLHLTPRQLAQGQQQPGHLSSAAEMDKGQALSAVLLIILALLLPPAAVAVVKGFGWHLVLNIVLWILIWLPATIHAIYLIVVDPRFGFTVAQPPATDGTASRAEQAQPQSSGPSAPQAPGN
eukprot:m51a1_g2494 hypothetical protein (309) ;mRNA; f:97730-99101